MRWALLLGLLTLLMAQQRPRFEVGSPLVMVAVSVTDAKARIVSGLEASDFLVSITTIEAATGGRGQTAAVAIYALN